jgi:phosphatidate phosphatase APP1
MLRSGSQTRVRPYYGYRNAHMLRLTARALRGSERDWERGSTFSKLRRFLSEFSSREVAGLPVTIEARCGELASEATVATDEEGYCRFELPLDRAWPLPEHSVWETVVLRWVSADGPQECNGYVLAPGHDNRMAVISDIDDTILETGAHDLWRNWRRVLAQMPSERAPVSGAAAFFAELGGQAAGETLPATRRPFFYVSSSPWNLFDYLSAFKSAHSLPHGPMLLRDWGLNRETFGTSSHGAHKSAAITRLIEFYPGKRFALIGDSTQSDAHAYAKAVKPDPSRIAGVMIRLAPGADVDPKEEAALASIREAGVPLWTGESFEIMDSFLEAMGLKPEGEAANIVEAIAETDQPEAAATSGAVQGETR